VYTAKNAAVVAWVSANFHCGWRNRRKSWTKSILNLP